MKTKEEIIELLVSLGKTSAEVAKSLEELEFTGDKFLGKGCPVAEYLIANGVVFRKGVSSMPGKRGYFWFDQEHWLLSDHPDLQGVVDFIRDFDAGLHSNCIR